MDQIFGVSADLWTAAYDKLGGNMSMDCVQRALLSFFTKVIPCDAMIGMIGYFSLLILTVGEENRAQVQRSLCALLRTRRATGALGDNVREESGGGEGRYGGPCGVPTRGVVLHGAPGFESREECRRSHPGAGAGGPMGGGRGGFGRLLRRMWTGEEQAWGPAAGVGARSSSRRARGAATRRSVRRRGQSSAAASANSSARTARGVRRSTCSAEGRILRGALRTKGGGGHVT